jgi:hypothetical protein
MSDYHLEIRDFDVTVLLEILHTFGSRWEIRHTDDGHAWCAIRRDGSSVRVIVGLSVAELRFKLEATEAGDLPRQQQQGQGHAATAVCPPSFARGWLRGPA